MIFLQALTSTAAKYSKSIPEFLFPDLVKQAEGFDNLDEEPGRECKDCHIQRLRALYPVSFGLEEGSKGAVPTPAASNNQACALTC